MAILANPFWEDYGEYNAKTDDEKISTNTIQSFLLSMNLSIVNAEIIKKI